MNATTMSNTLPSPNVAVIGAGVAGVACAGGLQRGGMQVTLFEKSRGVGGRMATRRIHWTDGESELSAEVDHGTQCFGARHPRFRAVMNRAVAAGCAAPWEPRIHAGWPCTATRHGFVAVPGMPALCRHLLDGQPVSLNQQARSLRRESDGWYVALLDGGEAGPFDQVVLAMPPPQAAALLAGHHDGWADALRAIRMQPCWTLMAVTNDIDWPWDAAEPETGPLAWVARNDRKPGRSAPAGVAVWVAHATAAWSAVHLEEDPEEVVGALRDALARQLACQAATAAPLRWHHVSAHRWRHASATSPGPDGLEAWWDGELGLGVCGDYLGSGDVEAAWRSGDELADTMSAWVEHAQEQAELAPVA